MAIRSSTKRASSPGQTAGILVSRHGQDAPRQGAEPGQHDLELLRQNDPPALEVLLKAVAKSCPAKLRVGDHQLVVMTRGQPH